MDTLLIFLLVSLAIALPSSRSYADLYPVANHSVPLHTSPQAAMQGNFEADFVVGNQSVRVQIDTGSSNVWFMQQSTQCLGLKTLRPISSKTCGYSGPRVIPGCPFQSLNAHQNNSYGFGGTTIAQLGHDTVAIGGIEVSQQEIGLVTTITDGPLQGNISGLVGLAYRSGTSSYPGSNPALDVACNGTAGATKPCCNERHYSPVLTTIFDRHLTPSVFALALSRGIPEAGVLTIGGIPEVSQPNVNVSNGAVEATVPIEKLGDSEHFQYYVITIDGLQYQGATPGADHRQFIVDSGTHQLAVGEAQAKIINGLFDPPGQFIDEGWLVFCNATAPEVGIKIGGETFGINTADMILPATGFGKGVCQSAFQPSISSPGYPPVLGSVFLRNVLAVHDVGRSKMTFASRMYYQSSS